MSCLREIRQKRRLSHKELVEAAGLTAASISRYETGDRKMSVEVAKRILIALHTDGHRYSMIN